MPKRIYQFKIELQGITPTIWRRIQVPETYSFWDLHVAIQDAMGWLDYHLHLFRVHREIERPNSFFETPSASKDLMRRSMETAGSPASIFAIRDWLDFMILASSDWVSLLLTRFAFNLSLSANFSSIYAISSTESPRNSSAAPNFHPFLSSLACFALFTVIFP